MMKSTHSKTPIDANPASFWCYCTIAYVTVVLSVDLLATYGRLPAFRWNHASGFDLYKCVFWLVIPFALSWRGMDWHAFTFRRWTRRDIVFLCALTALGLAALALVPHIPQLNAMYADQSHRSPEVKRALIQHYLVWDLSWLPGWEFLHRYFLLRAVAARWPKYGWLLVPLSEGLYHLPKSYVEAGGMVIFSLLATRWALQRRNIVIPFVAHAAIEVGLLFVLFR